MKRSKFRPLSVLLAVFLVLAVMFTAAALGIGLYAARAIDFEMDERLFLDAGEDSITRLYINGEGGERIPLLSDYTAVEWEGEAVGGGEMSLHTPLSEMPRALGDAFIAIEDRRFYRHDGVDVLRTARAALNSVLHFSPRFGGSTITQQLIKNIGGEREITAMRKLREMIRAVALERRHSKEEILEAYLNIVPLSQNCVGVGAASMTYFGKEPKDLTLAECAGLAAITRSPASLDPTRHPEAYTKRRDLVLSKMLEYGMITEEEYRAAKAEPLSLHSTAIRNMGAVSWYTETVLSDVRRDLVAAGYTDAAADALIYRGGLRIYTCADPTVQEILERYFESTAHFGGGEGMAAAMTVLDPKSGNLLGIVGNIGEKTGNRLRNHATDTLRAPGSALKPLALYAPAIEEGLITEATVFDDIPTRVENGAPWPRNASMGYAGLMLTGRAVADSRNTVAVSLYEQLGAEHIYGYLAHRLGINTLCRREERDGRILTDLAPAPLALGQLSYGVSLRELTAAYLPLADEGRMHAQRSYLLVTDADGRPILSLPAQSENVFSAATASVMTHLLMGVVEEGSARSLSLKHTVDVAGKTGTSGEARDRWFIGYTPYYLAGVWCGYESGGQAVGAGVQLAAFDAVMREIHRVCLAGEPLRSFTPAVGLVECRVCRDSGELISEACHHDARGDRGVTVWLPRGAVPTTECSRHVTVLYDAVSGGVIPDLSLLERAYDRDEDVRLEETALLILPERDLPEGVTVADAEYMYRKVGDTLCEAPDLPYFVTDAEDGRRLGIATDHPYNRLSPLCYRTVAEDEEKDKEGEEDRDEDSPPALFGKHKRLIKERRRRLLRHFYRN